MTNIIDPKLLSLEDDDMSGFMSDAYETSVEVEVEPSSPVDSLIAQWEAELDAARTLESPRHNPDVPMPPIESEETSVSDQYMSSYPYGSDGGDLDLLSEVSDPSVVPFPGNDYHGMTWRGLYPGDCMLPGQTFPGTNSMAFPPSPNMMPFPGQDINMAGPSLIPFYRQNVPFVRPPPTPYGMMPMWGQQAYNPHPYAFQGHPIAPYYPSPHPNFGSEYPQTPMIPGVNNVPQQQHLTSNPPLTQGFNSARQEPGGPASPTQGSANVAEQSSNDAPSIMRTDEDPQQEHDDAPSPTPTRKSNVSQKECDSQATEEELDRSRSPTPLSCIVVAASISSDDSSSESSPSSLQGYTTRSSKKQYMEMDKYRKQPPRAREEALKRLYRRKAKKVSAKQTLFRRQMKPLEAPLSQLALSMPEVAPIDIKSFLNRPISGRLMRDGKMGKACNAYFLYQKVYRPYACVIKEDGNPEQRYLCTIIGDSWRMETDEVRDRFFGYARIEDSKQRKLHAKYDFDPYPDVSHHVDASSRRNRNKEVVDLDAEYDEY
ncbi:hypothetical protein GGS20DRAFT_19522 [Poronia punctata]|nr:hypothetical protein GGS20DRAFT_19522 [Poronia punctata]